MLEKIEKKEIITIWDAMVKYEKKHFIMVITETVDKGQNDLGYVIYTADDKRELLKVPRAEYADLCIGFLHGIDAEAYPSYGGLEVVHHG